MASNVYVKSLMWLVSLGGLGYVLLRVTTPSEAKIEEIKKFASPASLSDAEKKKLLFLRKLKEAGEETPIYLQKKDK